MRPSKGIGFPASDKGRQHTSKAFIEFCESVHVAQSMSKAGYPYDNAPMERYFNAPKNECAKLYEFHPKSEMTGFVNGRAAQRCEAPLIKADSPDRLRATIQ